MTSFIAIIEFDAEDLGKADDIARAMSEDVQGAVIATREARGDQLSFQIEPDERPLPVELTPEQEAAYSRGIRHGAAHSSPIMPSDSSLDDYYMVGYAVGSGVETLGSQNARKRLSLPERGAIPYPGPR